MALTLHLPHRPARELEVRTARREHAQPSLVLAAVIAIFALPWMIATRHLPPEVDGEY